MDPGYAAGKILLTDIADNLLSQAFFNVHVLPLLSALLNPSMNNFELDTKSDKGSPAASGATAAGTPAESSSPRQISLPAEFLALCDEGHEDYDPRFSLTWGCLWDWLLFEFGIVSFALYVRPSAASKERSVKVAAPAPTTRPSRPSTVLKQNSGVNVASCLLAAPATAAAPAAAAPRPRPRPPRARSGGRLRCGGGRPSRRRSRGSTRRAAASVQREKRRASAVLAGGSWSGYVVTNPPREQPLNEDDCVYVFMSLRQLRDASAPNGRLSLLDNLRPRAPPAAAPPADAPAAAPITPQSLPPRLSDDSRNSSAFSSTSRVSDALPPPAATADADAGEGESSGASPGSLLSENAMLREALAVERRRNAQLATFLERALEKSGEEPATPTTPAGEL